MHSRDQGGGASKRLKYPPNLDKVSVINFLTRKHIPRRITDYREILPAHLFNSRMNLSTSMGYCPAIGITNRYNGEVNAFLTREKRDPNDPKSGKNLSNHLINSLLWSPDGEILFAAKTKYLKTSDFNGNCGGYVVRISDSNFEWAGEISADSKSVNCIDITHSGSHIVGCTGSSNMFLWTNTTEEIMRIQTDLLSSLSITALDNYIVTGNDKGDIGLWSLSNERMAYYRNVGEHSSCVTNVSCSRRSSLAASSSKDKMVRLWDIRDSEMIQEYKFNGEVNTVKICQSNDSLVLCGGCDHAVRVLDLRVGRVLKEFVKHEFDVTAVDFNPVHPSIMVSGDYRGVLHYWSLFSDEPVSTIVKAHSKRINCVAFHPLGHAMATAGNDASFRLWVRSQPGDRKECDRDYVLDKDVAETPRQPMYRDHPKTTVAPELLSSSSCSLLNVDSSFIPKSAPNVVEPSSDKPEIPPPTYVCPKCDKMGHYFRDCEEKVFIKYTCMNCGIPGHKINFCPYPKPKKNEMGK